VDEVADGATGSKSRSRKVIREAMNKKARDVRGLFWCRTQGLPAASRCRVTLLGRQARIVALRHDLLGIVGQLLRLG
jgi:hypothetical protein